MDLRNHVRSGLTRTERSIRRTWATRGGVVTTILLLLLGISLTVPHRVRQTDPIQGDTFEVDGTVFDVSLSPPDHLAHLSTEGLEAVRIPPGPDFSDLPIRKPALALAHVRPRIRCYAQQFSHDVGQPVRLFYAEDPQGTPARANTPIDSYAIYDASSDTLLLNKKWETGVSQPRREACRSHRGQGCAFTMHQDLATEHLPAGVYFAVLLDVHGPVSDQVYFVIRPAPAGAGHDRIAVMYPTFTWQAYNDIGGGSFYSTEPPQGRFEVSLLRPVPSNIMADIHNARATVPFVRHLRRMGVSPLHLSNLDLHEHPDYLQSVKVLILTGHDEYWTAEMRQAVDQFLERGGRLAVFAGNVCWWKINVRGPRLLVNKSGENTTDPEYQDTGNWYQPWIHHPVQATFGLTNHVGGYAVPYFWSLDDALKRGVSQADYESAYAITVTAPGHRIFRETGLKSGDRFGLDSLLVDFEPDTVPLHPDGSPTSSEMKAFPATLQVLGTAMVVNPYFTAVDGTKGRVVTNGVLTEHTTPAGGRVLHFGTSGWFGALDVDDVVPSLIFRNAIAYLAE